MIETDSPVAPTAPRLHYIDGLRACAMLTVLVYHCWLIGGMWTIDVGFGRHRLHLASLFSYGHIGVNLFLVLSGFCLYWPFVKGKMRQEPTLWEFIKRRCRRILPPYYVALSLFGGVPLIVALLRHGSLTPLLITQLTSIAWHLVMLHNLRPQYIMSIDPPFWSLALEFQLYLLFPILVASYRRFDARGVLLCVFVAATAYRYIVARGDYLPDDDYGYVLAYSVFGRCFEFALGMYAAQLIARTWNTASRLFTPTDYVFALGVIVIAILDGRRGHFQMLTDAMWGLLATGLLVFASRHGSRLHALLSKPRLVACGVFSYSVYLIHLPLIVALGQFSDKLGLSNEERIAYGLLFVAPLAVGLGYVFHVLFEKPFMRAAKPPDQSRIPVRHSGNKNHSDVLPEEVPAPT